MSQKLTDAQKSLLQKMTHFGAEGERGWVGNKATVQALKDKGFLVENGVKVAITLEGCEAIDMDYNDVVEAHLKAKAARMMRVYVADESVSATEEELVQWANWSNDPSYLVEAFVAAGGEIWSDSETSTLYPTEAVIEETPAPVEQTESGILVTNDTVTAAANSMSQEQKTLLSEMISTADATLHLTNRQHKKLTVAMSLCRLNMAESKHQFHPVRSSTYTVNALGMAVWNYLNNGALPQTITEETSVTSAPEIAVQVFEELDFANALQQGGHVLAAKVNEVGAELEERGLSHEEAVVAVAIPLVSRELVMGRDGYPVGILDIDVPAPAALVTMPKLSEAQTKMLRRLEHPRTIKHGQLDWFNPADKLHRLGLATKQEVEKKVFLFGLTEEGQRVLAALPAADAPVTTEIVPMVQQAKSKVHPVIDALLTLDIDGLGPIDALTKLYELKRMAAR